MKINSLPNQKYLDECFLYDADTGELKWKQRPVEHFKTTPARLTWNKRFAGEKAGALSKGGYLEVKLHGKMRKTHRIIWILFYGWDSNLMIDHVDGNQLNNKIDNLRMASDYGNQRNTRLNYRNKTGVAGVRAPKIGGYQAYIKASGKQIHLYYGQDFFEAVCARKSAERKYGYHPNHGRAA